MEMVGGGAHLHAHGRSEEGGASEDEPVVPVAAAEHGYEQGGSRYCSPQMQEREERRSRDGGRLLVGA